MDTTNQSHVDLEDGHCVALSDEKCDIRDDTDEKRRVDLELGEKIVLVNNSSGESGRWRDCRICHLSLDDDEELIISELGCSCKGDLAVAHNHCAQVWFNIKGNMTCEICGSLARNVVSGGHEAELEQWRSTVVATEVSTIIMIPSASHRQQTDECRDFWQGHGFLNFLLACMVFGFVIFWLFRFNLSP